jgi:hypothetical protein
MLQALCYSAAGLHHENGPGVGSYVPRRPGHTRYGQRPAPPLTLARRLLRPRVVHISCVNAVWLHRLSSGGRVVTSASAGATWARAPANGAASHT